MKIAAPAGLPVASNATAGMPAVSAGFPLPRQAYPEGVPSSAAIEKTDRKLFASHPFSVTTRLSSVRMACAQFFPSGF